MLDKPTRYPGLESFSGHLLAGVDVETTGLEAGYHEIIQIAIQPLDDMFQPAKGVNPFYLDIKPERPERAAKAALQINGASLADLYMYGTPSDVAIDLLVDWFQRLNLAPTRRIIPLAHNWPFDYSFLSNWLGPEMFSEIFSVHYRDTMEMAILLDDVSSQYGLDIFTQHYRLSTLCGKFGIEYIPHNALDDVLATCKLYPRLLEKIYLKSLQ